MTTKITSLINMTFVNKKGETNFYKLTYQGQELGRFHTTKQDRARKELTIQDVSFVELIQSCPELMMLVLNKLYPQS